MQIISKQIKKPYKDILVYYIGYVTINDSEYVKINIASPLYLIFNKMNQHFEEINENKYLIIASSTGENKK